MHLRYTLISLLALLLNLHLEGQNQFTLQQALQTAREHNPELKVEKYNLGIAEADITEAGLRPNFSLNNESIQMTRPSDFEKDPWNNAHNREVMWQLTKTFQIAGQRKNKIDFASRGRDFAERNYAEIESDLFTDVAEKWIDVWTANKQLEIIGTAKSYIDTLTTINRLRLKNDVITQTEMLRTELLADQYEMQEKTIRQEVANKQKELQFLLGLEEPVAIDTSDSFLYPVPADIDTLLARALELRSDVQASKSLVDMSEANIKLQNSMAYPQPELGMIWNPQNAVPHLGFSIGIDLPVFNRNQGERKKSLIMRDQAEQHLITVKTRLETEIQIAHASYLLQAQNVEKYQAILQQSQTILDNVKYTYLKGGTTIIDFLEAQRSWLETQELYYETVQEYRQSYIQLLYAAGLINQLAQ